MQEPRVGGPGGAGQQESATLANLRIDATLFLIILVDTGIVSRALLVEA